MPWSNNGFGFFQGDVWSSILYKISTAEHTLPSDLWKSAKYIDDERVVVAATPDRTQQAIIEKIDQKRKCFSAMGMVMEESKTDVLIGNGSQSMIKSLNGNITQKASTKFFGYQLQSNLKVEKTVNPLVSKINQMVGRIRQFPNLQMKCEITLYYAYVHSIVISDSSCILPFLSKNQSKKILRACNKSIRPIVTLKWK